MADMNQGCDYLDESRRKCRFVEAGGEPSRGENCSCWECLEALGYKVNKNHILILV